jgi:hypothetical protein
VLRQMRAAGVKAVGDELAETDIERLWLAAEGPYAPLAPAAATVVSLADRLAAERDDEADGHAEDEGGQLAFDLAA